MIGLMCFMNLAKQAPIVMNAYLNLYVSFEFLLLFLGLLFATCRSMLVILHMRLLVSTYSLQCFSSCHFCRWVRNVDVQLTLIHIHYILWKESCFCFFILTLYFFSYCLVGCMSCMQTLHAFEHLYPELYVVILNCPISLMFAINFQLHTSSVQISFIIVFEFVVL